MHKQYLNYFSISEANAAEHCGNEQILFTLLFRGVHRCTHIHSLGPDDLGVDKHKKVSREKYLSGKKILNPFIRGTKTEPGWNFQRRCRLFPVLTVHDLVSVIFDEFPFLCFYLHLSLEFLLWELR